MLTVSKLIPQGQGLAPVLLKRAASIELDWDTRQKSRFQAQDSSGRELGVFLAPGTLVRGGDVLVAEDGSLLRVIAAPQPLLRITACASHGSPFDLMRAAYHLGNRHVPVALQPDHLKIEPDHVLAEMLRAMHLDVAEVSEGFDPEGGAYAATPAATPHVHGPGCVHDHGPAHDHAHGHAHGHAHEHAHDHAPDHVHAPAKPAGKPLGIAVVAAAPAAHVHGPDCSHDHGHDHGHHGHGGHKHD
ncbi:urease accessory protein UreE [Paucibacter sp. APW11]|uniref:Urease accessory protein UreE n=1 Tax=Roseateles aquae TaxID=3077235 RepID=A0ABU3PFV1_9BURK|nr:urease accessory protein UreE [Paucibacter sp. APW11]MDT9001449.1 urease accessory protein UreE [Paucibacter sp. APW11]